MRYNIVFALFLYPLLAQSRHISEEKKKKDLQPVVTQESVGIPHTDNDNDEGKLSNKKLCGQSDHCAEETNLRPPQMPKLLNSIGNDEELVWSQSPYQINHYANTGTLGVGVGHHRGVLYPYVHPDLIAASNAFLPIGRLPPVYTTHIRNYTPFDLQTSSSARSIRSREEDEFLEELSHDAVMPNILPTMEIPMGRSYVKPNVHALGGLTAVFPGHPGSCGVPILLSCSPNISKGVLGKHLPETPSNDYRNVNSPKKVNKILEGHSKESILSQKAQ